jgi:hypothetical protein
MDSEKDDRLTTQKTLLDLIQDTTGKIDMLTADF